MRRSSVWGASVLVWTACSAPLPLPLPVPAPAADTPAETEVSEVEGAAGGGEADGTLVPTKLTGLPGIDRAQDLEMQILDARGTGRLGGVPIVPGQRNPLVAGQWMLTEGDSEYEITLRSSLVPDGIVRLRGQGAFLVEAQEGSLPGFRLFGGHASFYLPTLSQGPVRVLTPAGPLVTRGAVFTVTVAPDFQVLITCREGMVFLTGTQNAVVQPGQVLVADRLGRGRLYPMTPNEAMVFSDRWLKVMTEEAAPVVAAVLPRRLAEWQACDPRRDPEQARFLALWFRGARSVLGTKVPGPEAWSGILAGEVQPSVWAPEPPAPGLLGELP